MLKVSKAIQLIYCSMYQVHTKTFGQKLHHTHVVQKCILGLDIHVALCRYSNTVIYVFF